MQESRKQPQWISESGLEKQSPPPPPSTQYIALASLTVKELQSGAARDTCAFSEGLHCRGGAGARVMTATLRVGWGWGQGWGWGGDEVGMRGWYHAELFTSIQNRDGEAVVSSG